MDFNDDRPSSKGKSVIFVAVDRLSKYGYFIPLSYMYTAGLVVQVFFEQVFHLHRLSWLIISNRDATFTRNIWRELFKMQEISFNFSSSYHSQIDGQMEVVKRGSKSIYNAFAANIQGISSSG